MKVLNTLIDNLTGIIGKLCSICWVIIGIFCLYTAYELWQFSRVLAGVSIDSGVLTILTALFVLFGILFFLYAIVQFWRRSEMAILQFFRRRVPGLILTILTYGIFILLVVFFTVGEVSLRMEYARPLLIAGGLLLFLDLCVRLKLFPDSWDDSALIGWIRKKRKK